jgi:hypothetical protein
VGGYFQSLTKIFPNYTAPLATLVAALSSYLLTLKMVHNLYLPTATFCPLIPDLCLLLSLPPHDSNTEMEDVETLPPPAVLASMSKIINGRASTSSNFFLPDPTPACHLAWCKTFQRLVERFYPKTYARMSELGALTSVELSPIFERFFIPLLPMEFVHRIFDIYLLEGR